MLDNLLRTSLIMRTKYNGMISYDQKRKLKQLSQDLTHKIKISNSAILEQVIPQRESEEDILMSSRAH